MKLKEIVLLLCVLMSMFTLQAGNAVWWEGEDVVKSDFVTNAKLSKVAKLNRLSQQKWLNCFVETADKAKKQSYLAEYEIDVPVASEYTFWVRELYGRSASPWKFRFDNGSWIEAKSQQKFTNVIALDKDISIAWRQYGKVKLAEGKHKFEIQITERAGNRGFSSGFDSFHLTDVPFAPKSMRKPKVLAQYEFIGTYVWLEGEDAKSDFSDTIPGIPKKSNQLSEDKWLICSASVDDAPEKGFTAKWEFNIPISDVYYLWMRELTKNLESSFSYRFNNSKKWTKVNSGSVSFDNINIDKSSSVAWNNYGRYSLREGANILEIRLLDPNENDEFKLAIDVICLSLEPFTPAGKLRPDTKILPPEDWRVFRSGTAVNTEEKNVLSLRYLNEKHSGSHGFCKVDKKGLVFQDGTRVKFWGINAYEPMTMDKTSVNAFVAQMADFGVNLIRVKGPLNSGKDKKFGTVNREILDKLFYFIKACKDNGIYVALALYSPEEYLLSEDFVKQPAHPYGMLYINQKFREQYKKWTMFLTRMNPYTKLKLSNDPTIIWFEIENGKGIFSTAFNSIPLEQKQLLEKEYNGWLTAKYGDNKDIMNAWKIPNKYNPVIKADQLRGTCPSYKLFAPEKFSVKIITDTTTDYLNKRKADQLNFLIKHCRKVNSELILFLKNKCQFKGLISVGNSPTAVPEILDPVISYIHASGEIMARKSIFHANILDGKKKLNKKICYKDRSALKNPLASPLATPSFVGKANVTTAVSWPLPNKYKAEAVPLVAAYSALQGSNIYIWYNADSPSWGTRLSKYTIQDPAIIGSFPGYALMFRRGDLTPGKVLVSSQLGLPDILAMKGNRFPVEQFKDQQKLTKIPDSKGAINPLTCFAGKVEFSLNKSESKFMQDKESSTFINEAKKTIISSTGNLKLNYEKGNLMINSPRAQGITGFFTKDMPLNLHDVEITFNSDYGTILVISLDGKKIGTSKHLLVQFFTEEKNHKWKTTEVKVKRKIFKRLESIGDSPLIVKKASGTIVFPKFVAKDWKIWKLDMNGKHISQLKTESDLSLKIALPSDSFHIELIKK